MRLLIILLFCSFTSTAQLVSNNSLQGNSGVSLIHQEGNVHLMFPAVWGDGDYPVGGDVYIDPTDANKNVAVKMLHKDFFPPIFTSEVGIDIYIVQDGNTRLYDPDDALPEYQMGVLNEFWFVRDFNDSAVTEIYITILN